MAVAGGEWIIKINGEVAKTEEEEKIWERRSIYKLPHYIRDDNAQAYTPQIISFGPYHYGMEQLKPMEEHKEKALIHFLKDTHKGIDIYLNSLDKVYEELLEAYDQIDSKWKKEELLNLMVLDGCFMLEFLRNNPDTYHRDDPIFSKAGHSTIKPMIERDMLLIENQIPFIVLEKLAESSGRFEEKIPISPQLNKLISTFLGVHEVKDVKVCHVLGVYRRGILQLNGVSSHAELPKNTKFHWPKPTSKKLIASKEAKNSRGKISWSATELRKANVRFKPSETRSLKDIEFKNNILCLPAIPINHSSESLFLNLMAFERLRVRDGHRVSAYVYFMDGLIKSIDDVKYLHKKKIMKNDVGNDGDVDRLFDKLAKGLSHNQDDNLCAVQQQISEHYMNYEKKKFKRICGEWYRLLMDVYFGSPWSFLSVVAAIILLGMTVTQTWYSILGYKKS